MRLPFSFGKKGQVEYFLALLLRDEKASAVIFEERDGKIRVVGHSEEYFSKPIEETTIEELLEVLDKTISQAEKLLPPQIITKKTIFGVKDEWVEQSHIKKEYLLRLKKVSEELNLTPIGFLVLTEAIARMLEKEDGAPISAIFIEVGKEEITATLFRAGKSVESKSGKIEESIAKTTDALLHHFENSGVLPNRIIVYGTMKDEDLLQEFTHHRWSKNLPFLHVPNTILLPRGFDAKAVLFGAATQMGFEVLGESADIQKGSPEEDSEEPKVEKVEEAEEEIGQPEKKEKKENDEESSLEKIGFVRGTDVLKTKPMSSDSPESPKNDILTEEKPLPADITAEPAKKSNRSFFSMIFAVVAPIKSLSSVLPFSASNHESSLPRSSASSFVGGSKRKKFILIPPVIIVIFILLVAWYILGIKATVTLNIQPKTVERDEDIVFSAESSTDFSNNTIGAETTSIDLPGKVSTGATGKKSTGTKAKGSVTLFSRLSGSKTLEAGAAIKDSHGLTFTLDKAVTLASSSADASAEPTKTTVTVTASEFGKEQNLPSGTKFSVASFDIADLVAKNDSAFSGGTKKDVTVVSAADTKKLLSKLPESLEQKALDEGAKKISEEKALLPIFLDETVTKKDFNKNTGDEASNATLKGTVSFEGLIYNKNDVLSFAKDTIEDALDGMTLAKNGISYAIKDGKVQNDKKIQAVLHIKAGLVPKLKQDTLAGQVAGKSFDEAKAILRKSPQVTSVNISFNPQIPFLPDILPRISKNITIITNDE